MGLILSLETSTNVGSAALHQSGKLLLYHENQIEKSHSEHLATVINNLLQLADVKVNDLDAIAVSRGPGSYTGLRIGVSLAKGLCYAYDTKLIAVNTLQSMAKEVAGHIYEDVFLCPMIDARRMEVYCQLFNSDLKEKSEVSAEIIEEDSFSENLKTNKVLFFGNGAQKCKEIIKAPNARFIEDIVPRARFIGELAQAKYEAGEFENLAYFEPYYLKEFLAKKPSGKNLV